MKPTKEQVEVVNRLIKEAIDHGGDAGGPYFENGDNLYALMIMYRDIMWGRFGVFGRESGVSICMEKQEYPYFYLTEENMK